MSNYLEDKDLEFLKVAELQEEQQLLIYYL